MAFPALIRNCRWYFIGLMLLVINACFLLMVNGKAASFISLNSYHPFWLNVFFINYTFMGDGIFALCLIAMLFFYYKRKQQAGMLLISFLSSGLFAQIIKNMANSPRPRLYFEPGQYLYFIDGVSLANNSSFPSGHTTTAFAVATVLVMMIKNKNWQLPILLAATLVGYSRIYLAQHFLLDVIIGAIIGSATGIVSVYVVINFKEIRRAIRKMHRIKIYNNSQSHQQPTYLR